jgi:predicted nucleic acid-binding protein
MSAADVFFDTSIVFYLLSTDTRKADRVEALLGAGGAISVQVLNEFANVARRKLGLSWDELHEALAAIRVLFPTVLPLTVETNDQAMALARRHGFSIYDALVVAAALEGGCATLWSQDMQHGMAVEHRLTITDPFRS